MWCHLGTIVPLTTSVGLGVFEVIQNYSIHRVFMDLRELTGIGEPHGGTHVVPIRGTLILFLINKFLKKERMVWKGNKNRQADTNVDNQWLEVVYSSVIIYRHQSFTLALGYSPCACK